MERRTKQMMCLFANTKLPLSQAVDIDPSTLTLERLKAERVTWDNLCATGMSVDEMRQTFGIASLHDMVSLGLDAVELRNPIFTEQLIAAFGAQAIVETLVVDGEAALALVDAPTCVLLGLDTETLLQACAGDPIRALGVLRASGSVTEVLKRIRYDTLLNTGLRARSLQSAGYTLIALATHITPMPTPAQLTALGFKPKL